MFFAFDGLDGVGKTTQIDRFSAFLAARGHDVLRCQDPGSTPLGEEIRTLLLARRFEIGRMAEMLLFMAARAQLVAEVIRPALGHGQTVVSDRYLLANIVYQGHAGGLDVEMIRQLGRQITDGIQPDLVFLLDLSPEAAAKRRGRQADHMESHDAAYHERLRAGFLTEASRDPDRIVVIDAAQPVEAIERAIQAAALRVLEAE